MFKTLQIPPNLNESAMFSCLNQLKIDTCLYKTNYIEIKAYTTASIVIKPFHTDLRCSTVANEFGADLKIAFGDLEPPKQYIRRIASAASDSSKPLAHRWLLGSANKPK